MVSDKPLEYTLAVSKVLIPLSSLFAPRDLSVILSRGDPGVYARKLDVFKAFLFAQYPILPVGTAIAHTS